MYPEMNVTASHDAAPRYARSLVIFTRVDGALRDGSPLSCGLARAALATLLADHVPVVLVSDEDAASVQELQRELGVADPFICDGGGALYIPRGYFESLDGLTAGDDHWEMFSFGGHDPTRAVTLLTSLFAAEADDLVTIGLGCDWADRPLLAAVDVPIVVRNDEKDQRRLLRHLPTAYFTMAAGGAGWSEALIGFPAA